MKLVKTASGEQTIKMSKREWHNLGKKAGWVQAADTNRIVDSLQGLIQEERDNNNRDYHIEIEPGAGATYSGGGPTMYFYGTYPRSSVNHGMQRRVFIEEFENEDEAKSAAEVVKRTFKIDVPISKGSGYVEQELPKAPPAWFNPADAGEAWGEDDY